MILLLLLTGFACSDGGGDAESFFWSSDEDIHGSEALTVFNIPDPIEIVRTSDLAAVVVVESVESVETGGPLENKVNVLDPADREEFERFENAAINAPTATLYNAKVEQRIIGSSKDQITIETSGGLLPDGQPTFLDGWFLLEPGRTYLLSLYEKRDGTYQYSYARGSFDLTDGVKVLNHLDTRDLEHFEDMSVPDFVDYVKELATAGDAKTD